MRSPIPVLVVFLVICSPAAEARARRVPSPVAQQQARVQVLAKEKLRPTYAAALLELARRQAAAGDQRLAIATAREAIAAFDRLVELHKTLSEALTNPDQARAERAAARSLALQRDQAIWLVAELAEKQSDADMAIAHYVMIVQSQADTALGREAYAALGALRWSASPLPATALPVAVPSPTTVPVPVASSPIRLIPLPATSPGWGRP